jgi:hypothetical protein
MTLLETAGIIGRTWMARNEMFYKDQLGDTGIVGGSECKQLQQNRNQTCNNYQARPAMHQASPGKGTNILAVHQKQADLKPVFRVLNLCLVCA